MAMPMSTVTTIAACIQIEIGDIAPQGIAAHGPARRRGSGERARGSRAPDRPRAMFQP
jgi:hypothetical protein